MSVANSSMYRVLDRKYSKGQDNGVSLPGYKPPLWKHLFAVNGKLIDNTVLNIMEYVFNWGSEPNEENMPLQLQDALETYTDNSLLKDANPFFVPDCRPEKIRKHPLSSMEEGERLAVTFKSDYEPLDGDFAEKFHSYLGNETCRIHYWEHDMSGNPTIVILHSWCGGWLWMEERFLKARKFYNEGYDLAFVTLPFHGKRTPEQALFSGQMFPSTDIKLTMEAFGQALHDVHAALEWLRSEKEGPVGMMGLSLGGYITSLMAGLDPELDFAIPIIAPASFADILWFHGEDRPLRQAAKAENLGLEDLRELMEIFCPLHYEREISPEKIMVIAGLGDRIVPPCHSVSLWQNFDRPRISWFPGSHILHVGRSGYLDEILEWLDEKTTSREPLKKRI